MLSKDIKIALNISVNSRLEVPRYTVVHFLNNYIPTIYKKESFFRWKSFLKFQLTSEKRGCYNIYEPAIVLFPLLHTLQTLDGAIAKKRNSKLESKDLYQVQ